MSQAQVLVIGNCTLDLSFHVPRFPKPGETMLATDTTQDVGGKGANQAVAAARGGVPVLFCAAIGSDQTGKLMKDRLAGEDLCLDHILEVRTPTDQSIIYVTPGGENCIVSTRAAAASMDIERVHPVFEAATAGDILLMQGNLSHDLTRACLEEGRRRRIFTVLNPAPIQYAFEDIWPFVDCAILNEVETEHLTARPDPISGARRLRDDYEVPQVIVTLGAGGALLVYDDHVIEIPTERVEAVDTTGAGDVFCGLLVANLARDQKIETAARLAIRAATLSVTRHGTQRAFPDRGEIEHILETGIQ